MCECVFSRHMSERMTLVEMVVNIFRYACVCVLACIVMHNTVFISLYHSICVHSCSPFSFLSVYPPPSPPAIVPPALRRVLHLPIEDHGQTSSSLSIVCISQIKQKQKLKTNLVRSHTATHVRTRRIFSEFHCIHMRLFIFSFFSRPFFSLLQLSRNLISPLRCCSHIAHHLPAISMSCIRCVLKITIN